METVLILSYVCSAISAVVIMVGGYFLLRAMSRLGEEDPDVVDKKDE